MWINISTLKLSFYDPYDLHVNDVNGKPAQLVFHADTIQKTNVEDSILVNIDPHFSKACLSSSTLWLWLFCNFHAVVFALQTDFGLFPFRSLLSSKQMEFFALSLHVNNLPSIIMLPLVVLLYPPYCAQFNAGTSPFSLVFLRNWLVSIFPNPLPLPFDLPWLGSRSKSLTIGCKQ
jgi:hypothetical protein